MTRSHHIDRTRFTSLPIMVLPYSKRVPPKSFVRSRKMKTEVSKYSRPARTPPSTFLFLHLYLSNSPGPESPSPLIGSFRRPRPTTNDNRLTYRLLIHSSRRGASGGAETGLGRGPKQRRAQWAVYKPARSMLSTANVNKSSHRVGLFCRAKNPRFLRGLRWRCEK